MKSAAGLFARYPKKGRLEFSGSKPATDWQNGKEYPTKSENFFRSWECCICFQVSHGLRLRRERRCGAYAKVLDWKHFARATPLNLELSKGKHRAAGEMCPQDASLMTEKLPTERTQDGFYLRKTKFELPLDNGALDPKTQLDLLICHLFVNNKSSISEIARIGIDPPSIVRVLLEQGAIFERRQKSRAA
jgi:hypothetical protein